MISHKLHESFPDVAVYKSATNDAFFQGRNLPSFVKDYLLRRFSNHDGQIDADAIREYLAVKMPNDNENIKSRLLRGDRINITTRIVFKTDIGTGQVKFELPDASITSDAIVDGTLVDDRQSPLRWGTVGQCYSHIPSARGS